MNLPLANILHHTLRSTLSALGIGIGICMLVTLSGLARGTLYEVADRWEQVRADLIAYPDIWGDNLTTLSGVGLPDKYAGVFAARTAEKTYEAIARHDAALGFPRTETGRIVKDRGSLQAELVAGPPNAETRIELLETRGGLGRYRLRPTTGKTHQLRLQLSALGIPIVGDPLYPQVLDVDPDDFSTPLRLVARQWRRATRYDPPYGRHFGGHTARLHRALVYTARGLARRRTIRDRDATLVCARKAATSGDRHRAAARWHSGCGV